MRLLLVSLPLLVAGAPVVTPGSCQHGQDGYIIIVLKERDLTEQGRRLEAGAVPAGELFARNLRARWASVRSSTDNSIIHTYVHALQGVAAHLELSELNTVSAPS